MATLTSIRKEVLKELGVIGYGQTVTANNDEDTAVATRYTQWHALASEKNIVYWGDTDPVPDEAANPVISIIADECVNMFSKDYPISERRIFDLKQKRIQAEKDLRLLNNIDYQSSETEFEDF